LLDSSKHGTWTLTEEGRKAHVTEAEAGDIFKKWAAIHAEKRKKKAAGEPAKTVDTLFSESEDSTAVVEDDSPAPDSPLAKENLNLIDVLRSLSPLGFEKVSRELLRESGFVNVEITGGSADGGIDGFGVLEINPFVSFKVLFQCKRYGEGNLVGRSQVGDFRNAMLGRAEKGIIITTSSFTNAAILEANREGAPHVELVDGVKLVEMFQRVELGVKKRLVFDVDPGYFQKFMG
ncbi:MAG: restriction endonuclease, partial [Halomonas sp.]|nr:restriction endonuclease [Halomonas sp.]